MKENWLLDVEVLTAENDALKDEIDFIKENHEKELKTVVKAKDRLIEFYRWQNQQLQLNMTLSDGGERLCLPTKEILTQVTHQTNEAYPATPTSPQNWTRLHDRSAIGSTHDKMSMSTGSGRRERAQNCRTNTTPLSTPSISTTLNSQAAAAQVSFDDDGTGQGEENLDPARVDSEVGKDRHSGIAVGSKRVRGALPKRGSRLSSKFKPQTNVVSCKEPLSPLGGGNMNSSPEQLDAAADSANVTKTPVNRVRKKLIADSNTPSVFTPPDIFPEN